MDALDFALVLKSDHVASGKTLRSRLVVRNRSNTPVTVSPCKIAEGRYALVPLSDPGAELWVQPRTDCGGPYTFAPGYRDERRGPHFYARTKYGDPLPAGDYLAVLDIEGMSDRLEYQVRVTAPGPLT